MGHEWATLACAPAGCSRRPGGWGQSEPPGCLSGFQQPHPPNSMSQTKFIMVCVSLEVEKFGGAWLELEKQLAVLMHHVNVMIREE